MNYWTFNFWLIDNSMLCGSNPLGVHIDDLPHPIIQQKKGDLVCKKSKNSINLDRLSGFPLAYCSDQTCLTQHLAICSHITDLFPS